MRRTLLLLPLLALALAGGSSAHTATPACPKAWAGGWQKLANKIAKVPESATWHPVWMLASSAMFTPSAR